MSAPRPGAGALVLLFALEELRRRFGHLGAEGADPQSDTAPFRAFRERLLAVAAARARSDVRLSMWWEGTYNGYALAVEADPAAALPWEEGAAEICPVEERRLAPPRKDGYPLARVGPGRAELERGPDGALVEAPLGAPAGHFGAPGMRRIR